MGEGGGANPEGFLWQSQPGRELKCAHVQSSSLELVKMSHQSPAKVGRRCSFFVLPLSQAAASQGVFHPTVLPPPVVVTKVSPASPAETYPKGSEAQR